MIISNVKNWIRWIVRRYPLARKGVSFVRRCLWQAERLKLIVRNHSLAVLRPFLARSRANTEADSQERFGTSFRLLALSQFVDDDKSNFRFVIPAETQSYPAPIFFGNLRPAIADDEIITVDTPHVYAVRIESVTVVGKFDLAFHHGDAIHIDQVELNRDKFAEEAIEFAEADAVSCRIQVRVSAPLQRHRAPCAISLVGGATHNYVHWLTETLPKLLMIDRCPEFQDLPLLVDGDLHPNIHEALDFFNVHRREIIKVPKLHPVHLDSMVIVSSPTYVPFELRDSANVARTKLSPKAIQFSPTGISAIQTAIERLRPDASTSRSRRLYLRRNSTTRKITNITELEPLLEAAGFETIDPEHLTFREQVDLFQAATCVVCQAGAALGNLCLAPPGCLFVTFAARSEHVNYRYFSHLATVLGHTLAYVVGDPGEDQNAWSAHRDIRIEPADLAAALNEIERRLETLSGAKANRSTFVERGGAPIESSCRAA